MRDTRYTFLNSEQCFEQCVHLRISDELNEQALEDEKNMLTQKGTDNPTTLPLNARMDYIGSLAHNGVAEKIKEWDLAHHKSLFFNPYAHNDEYDIFYDIHKIDVQGQPMVRRSDGSMTRFVARNTRFRVKNEKEKKPMDYYVFCCVDVDYKMIHIAGCISYHDFWKRLNQEDPKAKHPCHYAFGYQLRDFRKYIYRV